MNKLKRYILFLIGLFVNALGVSLVTKASLGTSPISSIPYVLSLNFPFTLGNFTIVFSILLIVLQILILRKNFKLENILQIPVSIAFGYFIDLTKYTGYSAMKAAIRPRKLIPVRQFLLMGKSFLSMKITEPGLSPVDGAMWISPSHPTPRRKFLKKPAVRYTPKN